MRHDGEQLGEELDRRHPDDPDLTEIPDKVRGAAGEKRVSQGDIASILGLSRQAVNLRVNGKIPFAAWEIKRLSRELHVPIDVFFGDAFAVAS